MTKWLIVSFLVSANPFVKAFHPNMCSLSPTCLPCYGSRIAIRNFLSSPSPRSIALASQAKARQAKIILLQSRQTNSCLHPTALGQPGPTQSGRRSAAWLAHHRNWVSGSSRARTVQVEAVHCECSSPSPKGLVRESRDSLPSHR